MAPFQVRAVNTASESENRIHDDQVASEYGFAGGLVPGVTIYGYMASAVIEHLGLDWLESGAMDVRFFQPYYDGEQVQVTIVDAAEGKLKVDAGERASGTAWIADPPVATGLANHPMPDRQPASRETIRPGTLLGTLIKTLDLSAPGMAAPLDASVGDQRLTHPAILLSLANEILLANFVLGPWIHSSSEVRNVKSIRDGASVEVRGKIADAYQHKGHEFVVLDVAILSAGALVTSIRHTAIWQPRKVKI
jgi:hypothetical protein